MAERKIEEITYEIVSLNLDDLDVEELERRLELSTGNLIEGDDGGGGGGGGCGVNTCVADCSANCVGNCPSLCGCNSACGIDLY